MLQQPKTGQHLYEVAIYNKDVRAMVKENESHCYFDDHWADVQFHDIMAHNEEEARELIIRRFPPDDGFVIEDVHTTHMGLKRKA